jgi:hypothetical protein
MLVASSRFERPHRRQTLRIESVVLDVRQSSNGHITMTQNRLDDNIGDADLVQGGCQSTPKRAQSCPGDAGRCQGRTDHLADCAIQSSRLAVECLEDDVLDLRRRQALVGGRKGSERFLSSRRLE